MARRTKQEAEETRQQIIEAAEQCFHQKGIARTTLGDVAQTAGVTRGAIYWHFTDKSELLDVLLQRMTLPLDEIAEATRNTAEPDPLGRMRELLVQIFRRVELDASSRRMHEIMFHRCELTEAQNDTNQRLLQLYNTHSEHTELALRNACAKGQLPASLHLPTATLALKGFIVGVIHQWLLMPERSSLAESAEALADTALAMLQTQALQRN